MSRDLRHALQGTLALFKEHCNSGHQGSLGKQEHASIVEDSPSDTDGVKGRRVLENPSATPAQFGSYLVSNNLTLSSSERATLGLVSARQSLSVKKIPWEKEVPILIICSIDV